MLAKKIYYMILPQLVSLQIIRMETYIGTKGHLAKLRCVWIRGLFINKETKVSTSTILRPHLVLLHFTSEAVLAL